MIRRQMGNEYLLIDQDDHARLSGRLAEHWGNDQFQPSARQAELMIASAEHDGGWPLHDQRPTLNARGEPLDVFESPLSVTLRVWAEGVRRAEEMGDYIALLVSLHVLNLSAYAALNHKERMEVFEINKFQQREYERQELLRQRVGMRVDVPLRMGLVEEPAEPLEQQLAYDFAILQAVDRISLGLCCTKLLFPDVKNVRTSPDAPVQTMRMARTSDTALRIAPWPFDCGELSFDVKCRRISAGKYANEEEFQRALEKAAKTSLWVTIAE